MGGAVGLFRVLILGVWSEAVLSGLHYVKGCGDSTLPLSLCVSAYRHVLICIVNDWGRIGSVWMELHDKWLFAD